MGKRIKRERKKGNQEAMFLVREWLARTVRIAKTSGMWEAPQGAERPTKQPRVFGFGT